jgi:hypothetical protein
MTKDEFLKLRPRPEFIKWAGNRTLSRAWAECERADWMVWFLRQTKMPVTHEQWVRIAGALCSESTGNITRSITNSIKYSSGGSELTGNIKSIVLCSISGIRGYILFKEIKSPCRYSPESYREVEIRNVKT